MKKFLMLLIIHGCLVGCAMKAKQESSSGGSRDSKDVAKSVPAKAAAPAPVLVDAKDVATLEQMTKAVEAYVLKNEKKSFRSLCKDKRFDCFIDEKPFPAKKKKITRTVPPYASGSKMGLQGENRIHVRYDFYP